jgi:hypothetical protein
MWGRVLTEIDVDPGEVEVDALTLRLTWAGEFEYEHRLPGGDAHAVQALRYIADQIEQGRVVKEEALAEDALEEE